MKRSSIYLIAGFFLFAGLSLLLYPPISSWYNSRFQENAIIEYDKTVEEMTSKSREAALEEAKTYNDTLTGQGITDPFIPGGGLVLPDNYVSILDAGGGVMGYVEIPAISVKLPIFHGTSPEVLKRGVGHMEMTAFPIGGIGNHAVLTSHTGLPSSYLFDDLDKLEKGDRFYIEIFGQTTAYEIDDIQVVKPSNTKPLIPVEGKDYVSLVTCTPYAVNTHRLMVRGERIPFDENDLSDAGAASEPLTFHYDLVITLTVLGIVLAVLARVMMKKRKMYPKKQ